MQETRSTCCYCGVGCGVIIESDNGRITGVRGDPDHPANFGKLCTKGSTLHLTAAVDGTRALYPEVRLEKVAERRRASWDEALDLCADRFAAIIRQHGPDAVAFYLSGQLLTEDYYVFNKLGKGLVGTNNVDTNSRLCMSSAVAGYKATLGADAPPACYADFDFAECLFISGSNTAFAHPIAFRRIEEAKAARPEMKVIVVDPRRTDTAEFADLYLQILPGTDVALYNAMLHVMLWEGLCDNAFIEAHTVGFDGLKALVREYTPEMAGRTCGVAAADILTAARWFARSGATLSLYCQGLNQSCHGVDKNAALINLHLATGQIGKPGAGPFSLTGQSNAMGGREVGGLANLLSAHRDMANPQHRAEVAQLWGIDSVPEQPGKTAVELFEAIRQGEVKAVWIACTNPAFSLPQSGLVRQALEQAELVVVQEAYANTDTAAYADVLLPAASWGEKEGTVTNSERCITHLNAAVQPPGEARPDWDIAAEFARRLASRLGKAELGQRMFGYDRAETVYLEHCASTRGRDLDISGLNYAVLDEQGPQQWPYPAGATAGKVRLYEDGVFPTADGKARFHAAGYLPVADRVDARFPFHLTTGRLRDQWHGMSRTGTVARLFNHAEEPLLSMHPDDMAVRGLRTGDLVRVGSREGSLILPVQPSNDLRSGQLYIPMHWNGQFMSGMGSNALINGSFDPVSKQPELKHAAVRVEKMRFDWQVVMLKRGDAALLARLQPWLKEFGYARCGLAGRDNPVVVFYGAAESAMAEKWFAGLDAMFGLDELDTTMIYNDPSRTISKRVRVVDGHIDAVRLSGETAAQGWLKELMASGASAEAVRKWALAPVATPPAGQAGRGRIICNCFDVAENDIVREIAAGADLAALQGTLKCGTSCGSCVPEIKRLLAAGKAAG